MIIDGLSNENEWQKISPLPLIMQEPEFGGEPTEKTEIRIAYDDEYLYVSACCYDSEPNKIQKPSKKRDEMAGMGTTIASALFNIEQNNMIVAHLGDSRVYRVRDGNLEQITSDHSWVNEQMKKNIISEEEAKTHRWKNVITRALGNKPNINVDIKTMPIEEEDFYLDKETSQKLLMKTFVVHETALKLNEPQIVQFLSQMELILYEMANLDETDQNVLSGIKPIIKEAGLIEKSKQLQKIIQNSDILSS